MRVREYMYRLRAVLVTGLVVGTLLPACRAARPERHVPPEQQARLQTLRAQGTRGSLTIFPVIMGGSASGDVADVLALFLEKAGMANLTTTADQFHLSEGDSLDQVAEQFGEFVCDHPIETDYALLAEFVGTPQTGATEIRGVIVDQAGQIVLIEQRTSSDRDFKRAKPDCPMTCCLFLSERVLKRLRIPESARDDSGQGRFARMFAQNSPAPAQSEWDAMAHRQSALRSAGRSASVAVFSVRLSDDDVSKEDAAHLAEFLNKKNFFKAEAVDSPLRVKIRPARNEQKRLWDLARAFQDHLRRNPPEADYVLLADYIMGPRPAGVWAVHFVLCDRAGEWVIVDFQNAHHGDFQRIDPKTSDDCGRLVVKRLASYLR